MKSYLLSLFILTALTACGGGGGSSSDDGLPVDPVENPDDGSKDGDDGAGDDGSGDEDDGSGDGDDGSGDGDDGSGDEPEENSAPVVSASLEVNKTEADDAFIIDQQALLSNASDANGDTLNVTDLKYVSGDAKGMSISEDGLSINVEPFAYLSMHESDETKVFYEYSINDGRGGSVDSSVIINLTGLNTAPIVNGPIQIELSEFDKILTLKEEDIKAHFIDVEGHEISITNLELITDITNFTGIVGRHNDQVRVNVQPNDFTNFRSPDNEEMYINIRPSLVFLGINAGDEEGIEYSFEVTDEHGAMTETSLIFNITGSDNVEFADMTFPDPVFEACVLEEADDDDIEYDAQMDELSCNGPDKDDAEEGDVFIQSIEGIAQLKALTYLYVANSELTQVDVSKNKLLEDIAFYDGELTSIDLSNNPRLSGLTLTYNNIVELDLSKNPLISSLYLTDNELSEINLSALSELVAVRLSDNQLEAIDVSLNNKLSRLEVGGNDLHEINVSDNAGLYYLNLHGNQNLEELNVLSNDKLGDLRIYDTAIEDLNLQNNLEIKTLYVNDTNITELDVSNNEELTYINATGLPLTELNLDDNSKMEDLYINVESLTDEAYDYLQDLEDSTSIDMYFLGSRP